MKKVAILSCLDAAKVCTGAVCFQVWNEKSRYFACYAGEDAVLTAFFHCNGCDSDPSQDPGMIEKLDRLQKIGVNVVHTGVCTLSHQEKKSLCPRIKTIMEMLHERGIATVEGTH